MSASKAHVEPHRPPAVKVIDIQAVESAVPIHNNQARIGSISIATLVDTSAATLVGPVTGLRLVDPRQFPSAGLMANDDVAWIGNFPPVHLSRVEES